LILNIPAAYPKVGVGVMIEYDGKLLLARRKGAHGEGEWSCLGGHLEHGETPEQCARREAMEEGGVQLATTAFMGITNDIFLESGKHYITLWIRGTVTSAAASVTAPDEHSEIAWFDREALPDPLFLPLRNWLDGNGYRSQ
jgi:8-oxo-dGTP diphosphatase